MIGVVDVVNPENRIENESYYDDYADRADYADYHEYNSFADLPVVDLSQSGEDERKHGSDSRALLLP